MSWKKLVKLRKHGIYLFNANLVGIVVRDFVWKEGFCYQEIRTEEKVLRFLFTEFPSLRIFSKRKALEVLEERFSFVRKDLVGNPEEALELLRSFPFEKVGFPVFERKEGPGSFFKTRRGIEVFFPANHEPAIQKEEALSLLAPLPPYVWIKG